MHFHGRMQGFSIIELLAVMAAIGILIAIVFPTYTEMVDDKKEMKYAWKWSIFGLAIGTVFM